MNLLKVEYPPKSSSQSSQPLNHDDEVLVSAEYLAALELS